MKPRSLAIVVCTAAIITLGLVVAFTTDKPAGAGSLDADAAARVATRVAVEASVEVVSSAARDGRLSLHVSEPKGEDNLEKSLRLAAVSRIAAQEGFEWLDLTVDFPGGAQRESTKLFALDKPELDSSAAEKAVSEWISDVAKDSQVESIDFTFNQASYRADVVINGRQDAARLAVERLMGESIAQKEAGSLSVLTVTAYVDGGMVFRGAVDTILERQMRGYQAVGFEPEF